jgi:hypothetical protein
LSLAAPALMSRLLGSRRIGIVLSEHTNEDGATIFLEACKLGLEGVVSKRLMRLGQGQEPGQPGDGPRPGSPMVKRGYPPSLRI